MSDDGFDEEIWQSPATKGDVLQALVHVKRLTVKLLGLVNAVQGDDSKLYFERFQEYLDADALLDEFTDKLGGIKGSADE